MKSFPQWSLALVAMLGVCCSENSGTGAGARVAIPSDVRETCPTDTAVALEKSLVAATETYRIEANYYDNEGYLLESIEIECPLSSTSCFPEYPDMNDWKTGYVFLHNEVYLRGELYQERWTCYYYREME